MKKKIVAMCATVALAAVAIAGGSLAYFTGEDSAKNVMTIGSVAIEQIEQERGEGGVLQPFTQNKPVVPAVGPIAWAEDVLAVGGGNQKVFDADLKNVIDKFVHVKNTGKSDAYVRTIVVIEAPGYDPNDLIHVNTNDTVGVTATSWTPVTTAGGVDYVYSVFTYTNALAPNAETNVSLAQVFLDSKTTNEDVAAYGATWEIYAFSQAVQADGFDNAATALDTAFGAINADAVVALLA